jgi:putative peptidoglycan lipid II flippase
MIGVRLLSALAKNSALMALSAINLLVNIIGNYVLMQFLGVAGIALSTSIVYAISTGMIFLLVAIQLRKAEASGH